MPDQTLKTIAQEFRKRLQRLLVEYGVLQTVFLVLVTLDALVIADWRFRFSADLRLLSLLVLVAVLLACCFWGLYRPLRRTWTDSDVLGYADRAVGEGQDTLTTLRDLSHPETMREWETEQGKQIVRAVVQELAAKAREVDVSRLLRRQPVRNWRRLTGVLVAVFIAGMFFPRDPLSGSSYLSIGVRRILMPYASVYWPQNTRLLVQQPETGWRVPRGEPLVIRTRIEGEVPAAVEIVYRGSGQSWITERMAVGRDVIPPYAVEARFTFSEMNEPMTFYCLGGDDREQRRFTVTVAERPMISAIKATYTYPAYMRLPRKVTATGQIAAPEGTDVKLEFTASTELSKVVLSLDLDGQSPKSVPPAELNGKSFSYDLRLTSSGVYRVELTDRDNLSNARPERYEIRVDPDSPPQVTVEEPKGDMILTPSGKIHVKFKAKDDYNLTELSAMLGPEGGTAQPLSHTITGPFWSSATTLHPLGEGEFDLDFKIQADGALKNLKIQQGAELEFWIRAVDCNPSGKGVTESVKVRLSLLPPTDFMEAVVLKAKELMADARVGWYSAAGACHDGTKWLKDPKDDKALSSGLEQQQAAERAAGALALRFPEIVQHMQRNRMQDLLMSKRLDPIGVKINELNALLPEIAKKIAAGQPASAEEAQPDQRRAKMAGALRGVLADQNKAAWQMRILYDRLADWVALQSVLLKTRRVEELQRDVNGGTDRFVKKTLGREARELDDAEVRMMRELGGQQQTVQDMEEAVEKALMELIAQADKDGRKKVWEALAKAFDDLRRNRIKDKLKQAATFILDARGDVVRNDQRLVLETVATVNRGLIKAGEEAPEDPPAATLAALIDDPRGKADVVEKVKEQEGEAVEAEDYRKLKDRLDILGTAAADSLDETLEMAALSQEDTRTRTQHTAERADRLPRYTLLRTGLLSLRQAKIGSLFKKAVAQAEDYGKPGPQVGQASRLPASDKGGMEKTPDLPPDEGVGRTRERLMRQIQDYLACAEDANRLLESGDFSAVATGLQNHVQRGARELRAVMQESQKKHKLYSDHQATNFRDAFERPYLLRDKNLALAVDEGKNLEWALALQAAAQRECGLLAAALTPTLSPAGRGQGEGAGELSAPGKAALDRLAKSARAKCAEVSDLIGKTHAALLSGLEDPTDTTKENERAKPLFQKLLTPLDPKAFQEALAQADRKEYHALVQKQEGLRRAISGALVELTDLLDKPVPPKPSEDYLAKQETGEVVEGAGGFIEYRDEQPTVLADLIEKEGDWIDQQVGNPEVRKELVKRLRAMPKFDPRHARLQSAYFQAVAQHFQAKAKGRKDDDKKEPEPKK